MKAMRKGTLRMLSADRIVELHDGLTRAWHAVGQPESIEMDEAAMENTGVDSAWLRSLTLHHRANFDLWHIEDEARTPGATDAELADVKRRVDQTNQQRNDFVEQLDHSLLGWLGPLKLPNPVAPLNSESPGLMIDRLSILGLKIFHTCEEAEREGAPLGHALRNRERFEILKEQRDDLAGCLNVLWKETLAGTRQFKLYRQLKMYNDPTLNPAIYRKNLQYPDS
jgi:hypothetical protein